MTPPKIHSVWRLKGADSDQAPYIVTSVNKDWVYYHEIGVAKMPSLRTVDEFLENFREVEVTYGA